MAYSNGMAYADIKDFESAVKSMVLVKPNDWVINPNDRSISFKLSTAIDQMRISKLCKEQLPQGLDLGSKCSPSTQYSKPPFSLWWRYYV